MRLREFDYSFPGAYFISVCTHQRQNLFGSISNQTINLSPIGDVIDITWKNLGSNLNIELDEYVVMPNHFHGLVYIQDFHKDETRPSISSLISLIQTFKSMSTRRIHALGFSSQIWQRSYFDTIIKNEEHLNATRENIRNNPMNWELDSENIKQIP